MMPTVVIVSIHSRIDGYETQPPGIPQLAGFQKSDERCTAVCGEAGHFGEASPNTCLKWAKDGSRPGLGIVRQFQWRRLISDGFSDRITAMSCFTANLPDAFPFDVIGAAYGFALKQWK